MKNLADKTKRGLLIVFEGVDRAGKSTQLQMLKTYLENKKQERCMSISFPGKNII
jgi:thymidylate kinase